VLWDPHQERQTKAAIDRCLGEGLLLLQFCAPEELQEEEEEQGELLPSSSNPKASGGVVMDP
jgi:hypothetical protein